jgi:BA14K-like protein
MTHKIITSLTMLTLLAGAALIATPASAQDGRKSGALNTRNSIAPTARKPIASSQSTIWRRTSDQQYRAGLRAGLDRSVLQARASYIRGYGDGSDRHGYDPRINYGSPYVWRDGAYGRSRYDGYGTYARYDDGYNRDSNGYGPYARYDTGFNPVAALFGGLAGLSGAVAPLSPRLEQANGENWVAYCLSKYRSFDPSSGTFLADDGSRYHCS